MYQTEGIILSVEKSGEADIVLSIFTKQFGKVRCVAQSVRKNESKLRSILQSGYRVHCIFVPLRSGWYRLTSATLLESFPDIRKDSLKLSEMQFGYQIANGVLFETFQDEALWDFFLQWATELSGMQLNKTSLKNIRHWFLFNFLRHLGFSIEGEKVQTSLVEFCNTVPSSTLSARLSYAYHQYLGFSLPASSLIQ